MMKNKKYGLVWLAVILFILLAGIFLIRYDRAENETYEIIYIPKVIDEDNDFWSLLIEGVEMAAEENNAKVTIVAPESEEDIERQNELIVWAVEQKPDAILICPSSYTETTPYARKVVEAGIPLILIDSAIDADIADAVIATNNRKLGEIQGSFMKQFITEESRIAIVGHVKNSSTAIEREEGVRLGLKEDEDRIVDVVFCDSDYDKAYQLMSELMEKYPDISLVAGLNEYSAVGAARAIKDLNLADKVRMVGIDSSLEEIQLLEEGIFEGIVIQKPFKMGYLGVETAVKLLNGEQLIKYVDSGCELVTKEDVYTEENQKLLFPFKEE